MQKRGGQLKWTPKVPGKEDDLHGDANIVSNEEPSMLLAPCDGPRFEKHFMLQCFEVVHATQRSALAPDGSPAIDEKPANVCMVKLVIDDERGSVEKQASRRKKKQVREEQNAEIQEIPNEQQPAEEPVPSPYPQLMAADGGPLTPFNLEPLKRALTQELTSDMLVASPDAALMTYFSGGQYTAAMSPEVGMVGEYYTTVILRNIPNRYSRDMLAERLNKTLEGQYDFLYLPIDPNGKRNAGYAFINFRTPASCMRFFKEFNGKTTKQCLTKFSSNNVCEVTFAKVQGRDANIENLRDEKFIVDRPEWQPVFYDSDGAVMPLKKLLDDWVGGSKKDKGNKSGQSGPKVVRPPAATSARQVGPFTSMLTAADAGTTVVLRCIPDKYTRPLLLDRLNRRFKGSYDFVYLPPKLQVTSDCEANLGFAFINFRSPQLAARFASMFHRVKASICLPGVHSANVCEVAEARMANLEKHLENYFARSQTGSTDPSWRPLLFDATGNPLDFPTTRPVSASTHSVQPTVSLPPNPTRALDSRALEYRLHANACQAEEITAAQLVAAMSLGEMQVSAIRLQIEFYFSMDNLCRDLFLRSNMDEQGWIRIAIIAHFPKVKKFGASMADVARALQPSALVEIDPAEKFVRLRDEAARSKFSRVPEQYRF